jgi:Lysyl oxidase
MVEIGMKVIAVLGFVAVLCLVTSTLNLVNYYGISYAARCNIAGGLIPDLQVAVPHQLQVVKQDDRYLLRLSNGIANTGEGVWQMVPVIPADKDSPQKANQQFLDSSGKIVATCPTGSESVYHPAHKHFHISGVAEFAVHLGSPTSKDIIGTSLKVTSCLIDWVRLEGNSPNNERVYSSCDSGVQGISPGWVDQYHMSLEGQAVDITKAVDISKLQPDTIYYLVSKANPEKFFIEETLDNNIAWVKFQLNIDDTGNPKLEITGHSPCNDGLCGEDFPNR